MTGQFLIHLMHIRQLYDVTIEECSKLAGVTALEVNILLFLANHSEYNTARDICNMRMIPKSNASNGIRLLERKGYLRIVQDGENIKLHRLYLTEKAAAVVAVLKGKQEEYLAKISGALDAEEWKDFLQIINRIDIQAQTFLGDKKQMEM